MDKENEKQLLQQMFIAYAVSKSLAEVENMFNIFSDIDVNAQDENGNTVLHLVLESKKEGYLELVNFFIKRGADPNIKNGDKKTAFDLIDSEYEDILFGSALSSRSNSFDSTNSIDSGKTDVELYAFPIATDIAEDHSKTPTMDEVENNSAKIFPPSRPSFLAGIKAKAKAKAGSEGSPSATEEDKKVVTSRPSFLDGITNRNKGRSEDASSVKSSFKKDEPLQSPVSIDPLTPEDYLKPLDQIRSKVSKMTPQYIIDNNSIVEATNHQNPDVVFLLIRKLADAKGIDLEKKKEILQISKVALLENKDKINVAINKVKNLAEYKKALDYKEYERIENMNADAIRALGNLDAIAIIDRKIGLDDYLPSDRLEKLQAAQEKLRKAAIKKLYPNLTVEKNKTEELYEAAVRRAESSAEALKKSIENINKTLDKKEEIKENKVAKVKSVSVLSDNPPLLSAKTESAINAFQAAVKAKETAEIIDELKRDTVLRIYGEFTSKLISLNNLEKSGIIVPQKEKYVEESLVFYMNKALNHSNNPMVKNGIAAAVKTTDMAEIKRRALDPENQKIIAINLPSDEIEVKKEITSIFETIGIKKELVKVMSKAQYEAINVVNLKTPIIVGGDSVDRPISTKGVNSVNRI